MSAIREGDFEHPVAKSFLSLKLRAGAVWLEEEDQDWAEIRFPNILLRLNERDMYFYIVFFDQGVAVGYRKVHEDIDEHKPFEVGASHDTASYDNPDECSTLLLKTLAILEK